MPEPLWWCQFSLLSWVAVACAIVAVAVLLAWRPFQAAAREARLTQARKEFHKQREWLEVKFISLAAVSFNKEKGQGRPAGAAEGTTGPRWSNCEFDDAVSYVRHRATGELSAFVAVTVALEGIGRVNSSATELMSNLQAGTAVFRFDKSHWVTDGRVIQDLSPNEAIRAYQNEVEMVGQEMADRTA